MGCSFAALNIAQAHDTGFFPLDANGNNPSATDFGYVYCSDDGGEPTDHLLVRVEDASPPVPGLLLSIQISKDNKMTNITDIISGDGQASSGAMLKGGNGLYNISVNKTAAGVRNFNITYHCEASSGAHTVTDIGVYQVQ